MLHMSYINGRCRVLCTPTLTKRVFIYARVFMCVIQIMHRYHELGPFICHNPMNVFCHIIHASSQMQHYSPYKWHDSYLYVTCLPEDTCDMNRLIYDMTHVIPVPWLTSYMSWLIYSAFPTLSISSLLALDIGALAALTVTLAFYFDDLDEGCVRSKDTTNKPEKTLWTSQLTFFTSIWHKK